MTTSPRCGRRWSSRRICRSSDPQHRCEREAGHKGPCKCGCKARYINGLVVDDAATSSDSTRTLKPSDDAAPGG